MHTTSPSAKDERQTSLAELRRLATALATRSQSLDPAPEEFCQWLETCQIQLSQFFRKIDTSKSYHIFSSDELARWQDLALTLREPTALIEAVVEGLGSQGILTAGPGHLGYIPGGGLPIAAVADLVAAAVNPFSGDALASPVAAAIHQEALEVLFQWVGFDRATAFGDLTSGGTQATLMAIQTARNAHQIRGRDYHRTVVYLGEHTHHCATKALDVLFGGEILIRTVPSTTEHRLDPVLLATQVAHDREQGLRPFLIIGTAGSTNLGSVDSLSELATVAHANGMWFHVDGAYGGFFSLCPETAHLFDGLKRADSIVLDPHKGLFLPYGLGAVLIRDRKSLGQKNHKADYLQDRKLSSKPEKRGHLASSLGQLPPSPMDDSLELTRPFRSLRLWMTLKLYGRPTLQAALQEKLALTRYLRRALEDITGIEVVKAGDLSITAFRVVGDDSHQKTQALLKAINQDGDVFLTSTRLPDETFVIRVAILSFRTHIQTIDLTLEQIKRHLGGPL